MSELILIDEKLILRPYPEEELWDFTDLLMDCQCIASRDDRQLVIEKMRRMDPAFSVNHSSSERLHVHQLALACFKDARRLKELANIIADIEGETTTIAQLRDLQHELLHPEPTQGLRRRYRTLLARLLSGCELTESTIARLYRRCVPSRRSIPELQNEKLTPLEAISKLAQCNPDPRSSIIHPMLAFIELLACTLPERANSIRRLANAIGIEVGLLPAQIEQQRQQIEEGLIHTSVDEVAVLVDVAPDEVNPNSFFVKAWLWESGRSSLCAPAITVEQGEPLRQAVATAVTTGIGAAIDLQIMILEGGEKRGGMPCGRLAFARTRVSTGGTP